MPKDTLRNDLELYDRVADQWWSDDVRWIRTLKNMVPGRLSHFDKLVRWEGKRVLDLGCAGGFMAEALAERGAIVTGIDPAADAISAAKAHAVGKGITYDVGVGEALPYEDGAFDHVVCVDVLEHVQDLGQVCTEVARVLAPGGTFLFDTINRTLLARLAVITAAEDVLGLLPKGTHDPEMFIKPEELREALAAAGLQMEAITGLGPRGVNRRFDPVFGKLPFTFILYMGHATRRP
ncbi:MAG: bifunctional 2-polyprenyl-6-hydroxyphenol methylase/3-demethylubiquinol 3-O-methyltransferase UbiG [Pseudomonadota bacterium]